MKTIAAALASLALALAGCGPSVTVEQASPADLPAERVGSPVDVSLPGACLCPVPQVCDPESGGACRCPDAPVDVEAVCEDGERVAMCGDSMLPACHRAAVTSGERVACCQD